MSEVAVAVAVGVEVAVEGVGWVCIVPWNLVDEIHIDMP